MIKCLEVLLLTDVSRSPNTVCVLLSNHFTDTMRRVGGGTGAEERHLGQKRGILARTLCWLLEWPDGATKLINRISKITLLGITLCDMYHGRGVWPD